MKGRLNRSKCSRLLSHKRLEPLERLELLELEK